jgi:hypothetical protein
MKLVFAQYSNSLLGFSAQPTLLKFHEITLQTIFWVFPNYGGTHHLTAQHPNMSSVIFKVTKSISSSLY